VVAELPRQDPKTLLERIAAARQQGFDVGVNLGSLGASYDLLQTSHRVLRDLLPSAHRLDWDPFVWMALLCRTDAEWERQTDLSGASGQALQRLLAELPDFYQRIRGVREAHESIVGRPLRVVAYDFGHPLWVDFGLHVPARRALLALVGEPDEAAVARRLFGVSHPDSEGNTILRSTVAADARITNSVIIDSAIGAGSVVNRAVIVGSQVERLELPHGGAVLFSHAAAVHGGGSNAIVFGWRGETLQIAEGDRVALVASPNGSVEMRSNESLAQYAGPTFDLPVLGNPVSFAQAAALAAEHGATYFERDI
jgi:hypothetical protein